MNEATSVSSSFPGFLEAGDLDGKDVTLKIKLVRDSTPDDKGLDGKAMDKPIVVFIRAGKRVGAQQDKRQDDPPALRQQV